MSEPISRWEIGFRNIAGAIYGSSRDFELQDVVEEVRALVRRRNELTDVTLEALRNQNTSLAKLREAESVAAQRERDAVTRERAAWRTAIARRTLPEHTRAEIELAVFRLLSGKET